MHTFCYWLSLVVTLLVCFNTLMIVIGAKLINKQLEAQQKLALAMVPHKELRKHYLLHFGWHVGWMFVFIVIALHYGWFTMGAIQFAYSLIIMYRFWLTSSAPHNVIDTDEGRITFQKP